MATTSRSGRPRMMIHAVFLTAVQNSGSFVNMKR